MAERLYSTYQVADLLGATPGQVVEWMQKGWLPFQRLADGPVRITQHGLVTFLKRQGIDIESVMAKSVMRQEQSRAAALGDVGGGDSSGAERRLLIGSDSDASAEPDGTGGQAGEPALSDEVAGAQAEVPADSHADASPQAAAQVALAILDDAVRRRATHVHLERLHGGLSLRLRIDGVLHEKLNFAARLPEAVAPALIEQFKSMAGPGAAAFERTVQGRRVEFRIACLEALHGEKIVLRVGEMFPPAGELSRLRLCHEDAALIRRLAACPCGLVLLAGPVGTGRGRLLRAMAAELGKSKRSVAVVEDATEMEVDGVTYCPAGGASPGETIRSIAGADTDVILVEALQDAESMRAALDEAAGGRLVLAGVSADHAAQALEMVLETEAKPWALASTLRAILALRTVRRLCDECKVPAQQGAEPPAEFALSPGERHWTAGKCEKCGKTGYAGLTVAGAVFEIDDDLAGLLRRGANDEVLKAAAGRAGPRAIRRAALEKARRGATTLEELARVFP